MSTPLLTIGMIFRNDIRCIERCLKALQPLREAVSSELIMADTGSTDGSRQIAERYADSLFDFPWIDDFAAARNAVMDRASGKWFLTVDTDEYLDPDISELVRTLRDPKCKADMLTLIVRNYDSYEMDGAFSDLAAGRILRMSTGMRYEGNIHERWEPKPGRRASANLLKKTVFHHDGYAVLQDEQGKEKRQRNLRLLQKKLEQNPGSLQTWLELIESGFNQPEIMDYVRQAVELVEEKAYGWEKLGPPIFRYAVNAALERNLPEFDVWVQRARELFPKSLYTRLDVEYVTSVNYWNKGDYRACIECGERYLAALADFRAGKFDPGTQMYSTLQRATPAREAGLRVVMAMACVKEMKMERAFQLLNDVDFSLLSSEQVTYTTQVMMDMHSKSDLDTAPLVTDFWNGITSEKLSQKQINANKRSFIKALEPAFARDAWGRETMTAGFRRNAYTLVLPLENKLELGRTAAILNTEDPQLLDEKLARVNDWDQVSIQALGYALRRGATFPPVGRTMNVEEMDRLAKRLLRADERVIPWLADPDIDGGPQSLCWVHSMVVAAVQTFKWAGDGTDTVMGLGLARAFARVEKEFLSLCYAPGALEEARLFLLPPLHRFGWYCAQAYEALDRGDAASYVRFLRKGLSACTDAKAMVEFLTRNTPKLQSPAPSAELTALAEQIRTILSAYGPDHPAVAAIKNSEAYQKVAYLIEGASVPVVGGLLQ